MVSMSLKLLPLTSLKRYKYSLLIRISLDLLHLRFGWWCKLEWIVACVCLLSRIVACVCLLIRIVACVCLLSRISSKLVKRISCWKTLWIDGRTDTLSSRTIFCFTTTKYCRMTSYSGTVSLLALMRVLTTPMCTEWYSLLVVSLDGWLDFLNIISPSLIVLLLLYDLPVSCFFLSLPSVFLPPFFCLSFSPLLSSLGSVTASRPGVTHLLAASAYVVMTINQARFLGWTLY